MKRRGDSPYQTFFDWKVPSAPSSCVDAVVQDAKPLMDEAEAPGDDRRPNRERKSLDRDQPQQSAGLIQRLPWDFRTTFPEPRDDAIEEGKLDETDREPENLKSLHESYAQHCLATLKQLDIVTDARRRGIDPATGKKPRTHASRERLRRYVADEPGRLEHAFTVLIDTYRDAFGDDAADAFQKAIRAWHSGIEVVADHVPDARKMVPRRNDHLGDVTDMIRDKPKRISSAMPVPKPLASSVARGVFGHEENGKPVRPSPQEVRDITETAAEKMIDMLRERKCEPFKSAVAKYAEDFGEQAAMRLERYARRRLHNDGRDR